MSETRDALRSTLLEALKAAGAIMRRGFGKARIEYKGRANLVTQIDKACEAKILSLILKRFPDHDYLAEERAPRRRGAEHLWIIDPLDGTTNFAHGYPASCVSIGLARGGEPVLGGIFDPFREELFLAEAGRGATLNGKRIRVTSTPSLDRSLVLTGFAYDRLQRSRFYVEYYRRFMISSHDVRRSGSAALDLAWVAAGRADGYWEFNLQPWDVAAGMLLIREAGGTVSDFSGRDWGGDPSSWGRQTLAANSKVHRGMLRVFDEPGPWRMPDAHKRR
ncbi:MAG: inositol monophosphatase [Elusimicrobia bacterium]|nr:inositol monophosphatase [Elusimicrobiota bacterium]